MSKSTKHFEYRPEIDGLRAIAVVTVLLFHARLGLSGGYVGVDVFFVISGFLIGTLILSELDAGSFSMARFYERRIRRIAPALIAVIVCTTIAGWFLLLPDDFRDLGRSIWAQALLVSNIYFWRETGYFAAPGDSKPLLHLWSLAVEEQFYILLPLLMIGLDRWRIISKRNAITSLAVVSFVLSIYGVTRDSSVAFYLLPTRAWELLVGCNLAIHRARVPLSRPIAEIASAIGLVAILGSAILYDARTPFPGLAALPPCLGTALIIWSNAPFLTATGRLLTMPILVFIGLTSYSLYLWHWPVLVYSQYWRTEELPIGIRCTLLLGSFVVAMISWRWIEKPFRQRRVLQERRAIFYASAAAFGIIFMMGVTIDYFDGISTRFSPQTLAYANGRDDRAFASNTEIFDEIGNNTKPIKCLVWGDSHAMAVMPAIEHVCRVEDSRCVYALRSATLPLLNAKTISAYFVDPGESDFNNSVIEFVRKHPVENVLLVGCWSRVDPTLANSKAVRERIPPKEFSQWLLQTVQSLQNTGAKVWIMQQVPLQRGDVPRALARASIVGRDPRQIGVPLTEHRQLFESAAQVIGALSKSNVGVLDPSEILSDESGFCGAEREGRAMYRDHHHLSVHGAMYLVPLFEPIFRIK